MSKIIVGDLHIKESELQELDRIFEKDILPISADEFLQVGDWFHSNKPTPKEQVFSVELIQKLKKQFKKVTILSGNGKHDILNGTSAIEYFRVLGVNCVVGDHIEDNILYGHWMVQESEHAFGHFRCSAKDLKQYKYVFLGHEHKPQDMGNVFHVGSVRYTSFGEVGDGGKRLIMLKDDGSLEFIPLNATIPMVEVNDIKELDNLSPDTKACLVFSTFESFKKNINKLSDYKDRFVKFKTKCEFDSITKQEKPQFKNKTDIIKNYLDKITDEEIKSILIKEFDKCK